MLGKEKKLVEKDTKINDNMPGLNSSKFSIFLKSKWFYCRSLYKK